MSGSCFAAPDGVTLAEPCGGDKHVEQMPGLMRSGPGGGAGSTSRAALGDKGNDDVTGTNTKLTPAVETYFADRGRVRASGGAIGSDRATGRS